MNIKSILALAACLPNFALSAGLGNMETFSPAYEGNYTMSLACQPQDTSPACKKLRGKQYSLVVLNYGDGLSVGVPNLEHGFPPLYIFDIQTMEKNGGALKGGVVFPNPAQAKAELDITIDRVENKLVGWIRDPQYKYDLRIEGKQKYSAGAYYQKAGTLPPLAPVNIVGNFTYTEPDGRKDHLYIRKSALNDSFIVQLVDWAGNKYNFDSTLFYSDRHSVSFLKQLFYYPAGFHKMTFAYSEDANGNPTLKGMSFNSASAYALGYTFVRDLP